MLEQQKKEKIYLKKHKKFDLKRIEMKGAIVDLLLLLFLKLEKEAEQIEEGKSLDILGEIIQSETSMIKYHSHNEKGLTGLAKPYTQYLIEKFLLLLCKYSNKFNKDLFLLLSIDSKESRGSQNKQLEVSIKLIDFADIFCANYIDIIMNH